MNTDDQHALLTPRRGPAPLTPSELAEQLATDYPQLRIHPDAPLIGGMGAVYSATLTTTEGQHHVAIKVLHWHLMDDPAFTARFQREQALLRQLDHPNIVKLRDIGHTAEGQPFLVMDWIAGRSLTEFTQPGSTTDRQLLLRIADDLCAATQHAHEQGILHRDLKPQNIIVTQEGRAIVLDFGIARSLRPGHTLTQPGGAPGTHGYIAPEVLAGKKPDARADIYSLGIIIYQLLMKKLPHLGSKFPSEASLDPRFDAIYRKAIADWEDRYQTAAEFAEALAEATPTPTNNTIMNTKTGCIAGAIALGLTAVLTLAFGVLWFTKTSFTSTHEASSHKAVVTAIAEAEKIRITVEQAANKPMQDTDSKVARGIHLL